MPSIARCIPSSEAELREKEAIKRAKRRLAIYNEDFKNHYTDIWKKMVKKKKKRKSLKVMIKGFGRCLEISLMRKF